ncbi:MAG: sialidase family protein [Akkermansiaceae bacterium]
MKKLFIPSIVLCCSFLLGFAQEIALEKKIVHEPGQFLSSFEGIELPEGMVVQGSQVFYKASVTGMDAATTRFHFAFKQKRGEIAFKKGISSINSFRADWYGENVIVVTAKDASGKMATKEDSVICEFASRRVQGGDAESLPEDYRENIRRGEIHDIRKSEKGMAYLPSDVSRGDQGSDQMKMGFFECTEPRIFKTSKGTLLTITQARRIGKSDAPKGQAILIKRSEDQGARWTHEMMLEQNGNDVWGYSATVEVNGVISCYVAAGHPSHQNSNLKLRGLYYFTSKDDGNTWSTCKRHDQISKVMGFRVGGEIPRGTSPNCNILVVPGLSIDGKVAPKGAGLLLSTYAHGYLWASINGGEEWEMVADYKDLTEQKVNILNELGWCVLDNPDGDIYMVWRRQAFTGFKEEYILSKHFRSGTNGLQLKKIYNQKLKNTLARRCHFGLRNIQHGPNKSQVLIATQGAGSRHHIILGRSKKPITDEIHADMYEAVTVMKDIAWGYCDLEHLHVNEPGYGGLGKDAIILYGESEPVHKETHQFIPLSPSGKGRDERYTATCFILSMDYFDFLSGLEKRKNWVDPSFVSFEPSQGWEKYATQKTPHEIEGSITDHQGNIWSDIYLYNREQGVAKSGSNCLVLGNKGNGLQTSTVKLAKNKTSKVSFHIKSFSGRFKNLKLTVEHRVGLRGSWKVALAKDYSKEPIPQKYVKVEVPLDASGEIEVRFGVEGLKGFLIDDFKAE